MRLIKNEEVDMCYFIRKQFLWLFTSIFIEKGRKRDNILKGRERDGERIFK